MAEQLTFRLRGDHHDIPLALGLVVMAWNSCELGLRDLICAISARRNYENRRLVEVLVSEMGTLSLTQAIRCYADEVPADQHELATALKHVAELSERLKAYRNYYAHGIRGVTQYGIFFDEELIERDAPMSEAFYEGPFANIYQKSAKGRSRFILDFIEAKQLLWLNNHLVDADRYIRGVAVSFAHFFRGKNWRKSAPLPEPPPLPDVLVKPEVRHPKTRPIPALMPLAQRRRLIEERE